MTPQDPAPDGRGAGSSAFAGATADKSDPAEAGETPKTPSIDVAALAERVYRLMCREVRVDRARGASLFGTRS